MLTISTTDRLNKINNVFSLQSDSMTYDKNLQYQKVSVPIENQKPKTLICWSSKVAHYS